MHVLGRFVVIIIDFLLFFSVLDIRPNNLA